MQAESQTLREYHLRGRRSRPQWYAGNQEVDEARGYLERGFDSKMRQRPMIRNQVSALIDARALNPVLGLGEGESEIRAYS